MNFYSHIPCGMWLTLLAVSPFLMYFYSHIPCGMWLGYSMFISFRLNFYSHIPCGMWLCLLLPNIGTIGFLLTHPLWDVTAACSCVNPSKSISTHTSLVGCDDTYCNIQISPCISTHTSLVGCDTGRPFLEVFEYISTHTSLVGCDWLAALDEF